MEGLLLTVTLAVVPYLWFKKYESTDLPSLVVLLAIVPTFWAVAWRFVLDSAPLSILSIYATYLSTILLCVVLYRTSPLHPLYKYPGPLLCRISKLWLVYISSQGKQNEYFQEVHEKYGSIVRIGPNELSIVDETCLPSIMGANGMPKGPLWDGRRTNRNLDIHTTKANLIGARDLKQHAEARKNWNRAFTSASVKLYEPILIRRAMQLIDELNKKFTESSSRKGAIEVDLAEWLNFFSLDFMGDFVFSEASELMRDGDKYGLLPLMEGGTYVAALTQHIPWCLDALSFSPVLFKKMKGLGEFAYRQAMRRITEIPMQNDLMYHLNEEDQVNSEPPPRPLVLWSAVIAVIAGSDGPASALANAIYSLICHPACFARLRADIDQEFPPGEGATINPAKLARVEYLNAFINEVLRLYPPIGTCLQRAPTKGSGGHMIGSALFVPEGTAVYVPPYVYHRDPRYFSPDPDQFWPERWLSDKKDDVVLNTGAFLPFSLGPANCVGKPLALVQMRVVIAQFVQTFDMRFADGYHKDQWERDLRDYFITHRGTLPVVLTPRTFSDGMSAPL